MPNDAPPIDLRPHQQLAVVQLRQAIKEGHKRIVLMAACAFGKTRTAAFMAASGAARGRRTIFVCDRIELIDQASAAFDDLGIDHGIIQADHPRTRPNAMVQVASIQTLAAKRVRQANIERDREQGKDISQKRLDAAVMPKAEIIIIDECHSVFEEHKKLISENPDAVVIGLSATPWTKGLGKIYHENAVNPITVQELIDAGFLIEPVVYGPPKDLDLSKVGVVAGEFRDDDLSAAVNKAEIVGDIVSQWIEVAYDEPTICFAVNVNHSKAIVESFVKAGIKAEHIDGYETDKDVRREKINRLKRGEIKVLSSVDILSKGFDYPGARCAIMARPTKSKMLFIQQIGRICRTHDNIAVLYSSYKESRDVCRSDEMDAGRQGGEHGGGGDGVSVRSCEAAGIHALEREEPKAFTQEGACLPAVSRPWQGSACGGQLPYCCDTREVLQRPQTCGAGLDSKPGEQATSKSQRWEQAEQQLQQPGVGNKSEQHDSCTRAWLVPGNSRGGSRQEQAERVGSAGNKAGVEELSSWSIDRTGKKIRRSHNDNIGNSCWEKLGACFVAEFASDCSRIAEDLYVLHKGEECLLVVDKSTDTGNAKKIIGAIVKSNATILDHAGNHERLGFVTDEFDTTLDTGKKATSEAKKQEAKPEPLAKKCPSCHFIKPASVHKCPACGFEPRGPDKVLVIDGKLSVISKKKDKGQKELSERFGTKQEVYSMLGMYCQERGYSYGFRANQFKAIFGVWPKGLHDAPRGLTAELRSWLLAEQIRFASSKAAARKVSA